ncbi:hypothetical protein QP090_24380 [Actinomadura xylanilytica]|nr:hypothetical protein [Actinomadura xylanilytica]MDL4775304.1 hypothetical protein [Actinomadura xylanilytica]
MDGSVLRGPDEDGHETGELQGSRGPAADLDGPDLVEYDTAPGQDEGEGQQCRAGVAVVERVEEAHVQMGACRAGGQRDGGVVGLLEACVEAPPSVRVQAVALAASLGEGGSGTEVWPFGAQDVALPAAHGGEVEGTAGGDVRSQGGQGREQAQGAFWGTAVCVRLDEVRHAVADSDDLTGGAWTGVLNIRPGHLVSHPAPQVEMVGDGGHASRLTGQGLGQPRRYLLDRLR